MTTAGWSACACSIQNPRTHPPPGGADTDSQPQDISLIASLVRAQTARRGEDAPPVPPSSLAWFSRAGIVAPVVPRPLTGSVRLHAEPTISPSSPPRSTSAGRAARSASSTLLNPMARLWRAVQRRLAYPPRFLRHYHIGVKSDRAHACLPQRPRTNAETLTRDRVAAFRQTILVTADG